MGKILPGVLLAFENTKGGVGKSTLTTLFAGYLHSIGKDKGLQIGIVDIDDAQNSIGTMRLFDKAQAENLEEEYQIMSISSADFTSQIDFLKESFDIILVDFPGNLKQQGVVESLMLIDIVIIPFEASKLEVTPTIRFYEYYAENIQSKREALGFKTIVRGLPNRVMSNLTEYKELVAKQDELPFKLLKNHIPDSRVRFQRNLSTLLKGSDNNSSEFGEELIELIMNFIKE